MLIKYSPQTNLAPGVVNLNGSSTEICFNVAPCDRIVKKGQLVNCDDRWECNVGTGRRSCPLPWMVGDVIYIQTQFKDTRNTGDLIDGWGDFIQAEIITNNGNSTTITDFANEYMVGNQGGRAYQVICVDTSLPFFEDVTCWFLHFTTFNQDGNIVREDICTQEYKKTANCAKNTVEVEPVFSLELDCFNNYYGSYDEWVGTSEVIYMPKIRIPANLIEDDYDVVKTEFAKIATVTTACRYNLSINKLIAPYLKNIIVGQLAAADYLIINGETYDTPLTFAPGGRVYGKMSLFSVPLTQTCTVDRCV